MDNRNKPKGDPDIGIIRYRLENIYIYYIQKYQRQGRLFSRKPEDIGKEPNVRLVMENTTANMKHAVNSFKKI